MAEILPINSTVGAGAGFEFLIFALQPRGFQRVLDLQNQTVGLERFFDKIKGAHFDGRDRGFDIAVAADHDDRHVGEFVADILQDFHAVHRAALSQMSRMTRFGLRCWIALRVSSALPASRTERPSSFRMPLMRSTDIGFVIDDKNIVGQIFIFNGLHHMD